MVRRSVLRWTGISVGAVLALTTAFTLGVVAGAGSTPDHDDASTPQPGVLDDAAADIAGSALHPVDREVLDAAAIKAMLGAAGDQWGSWAETSPNGGAYAGVGLWLRRSGPTLLVARVAAGSPAQTAGAGVGDAVRAVDGASTRGRSAADVAASLRGAMGTTVSLLLQHGSAIRTLTLQRAPVAAVSVSSVMLSPSIGRITVPLFAGGTGRAVRDALTALKHEGATGIVLDLRGNPGGLLTEGVETASAFLRGGPVVTYTRRTAKPVTLSAIGSGDTRIPLVVLVDGGTASAAEVVTGALQDRGRGVVVGSRTFGKGTIQEPLVLSDGSSLDLTVASYTLPSGRSVDGVGIEPDIDVVSAQPATALRRAEEVLAGLSADAGGQG